MEITELKSKIRTYYKYYLKYAPISFIILLFFNILLIKNIYFIAIITISFSIPFLIPSIIRFIYLIVKLIIFITDNWIIIKSTFKFLITSIFHIFIISFSILTIYFFLIEHYQLIKMFDNPFSYISFSILYLITFTLLFCIYLQIYQELFMNDNINYEFSIAVFKVLSIIISTTVVGFHNSIIEYITVSFKNNIFIKEFELINIHLTITMFLYILVGTTILIPILLKFIFLKENP